MNDKPTNMEKGDNNPNERPKMKNWIPIGVVVVIVALILGGVFFSGRHKVEGRIKIGAVLPLTGGLADLGNASKQGIQLAVEELNKKSDLKFDLVLEDGKADSQTSLDVAQNMVNTQGVSILLTAFRGASLSIASGLKNSNVIILASTAIIEGNPITKTGSNFIPVGAEMKNAGRAVGIYASKKGNCSSVGLISETTDAGKAKLAGFKDNFGVGTFSEYLVSTSETDYRSIITKLKGDGVNCIFFEIRPNLLPNFLKQAIELNFTPHMYSNSYSITESVLDNSELRSATEGLVFSINSLPNNDNAQKFRESYKNKFTKEANDFSSIMYDLVQIAHQSAKTCNSVDLACISKNIKSLNGYSGVSGTISFSKVGEGALKEYSLKEIASGKIIDIK